MIRWETDKHEGVTFVAGTILENTPVGEADDLPRIYYVTTPEGLTWSLNQNVITRAIDRHIERKRIAERKKTPDADQLASDVEEDADPHRFASQIAATMSGEGAITLARANDRQSYLTMSRLSWSNLPILNYLRHQYPDRDPQLVYQQLLGERLVDPGGGQYHWVEKYKTYESTLYGHRLAPQKGPLFSPTIRPQDLVEGQLSFDDGGLRVKLNVTSKN